MSPTLMQLRRDNKKPPAWEQVARLLGQGISEYDLTVEVEKRSKGKVRVVHAVDVEHTERRLIG